MIELLLAFLNLLDLLPKDRETARKKEQAFSRAGDGLRWVVYGVIFFAVLVLIVAGCALLLID